MSQTINNAQRALAQTGTAVQKLFVELPKTVEAQLAEIQENANTIADQEATLEAGRKAIDTEAREAAAELRLRIKEDSAAVLNTLLAERGLITTTVDEVREQNQAVIDAEARADAEEYKAVKEAQNALHAKYGAEISALKADNKVALATYEAQSSADKSKIELLEAQVADLRSDLKAERDARIAIAESAAKAQGVVVNTGK